MRDWEDHRDTKVFALNNEKFVGSSDTEKPQVEQVKCELPTRLPGGDGE